MSSSSTAVGRTRSMRKPAPAAGLLKDADASKPARPADALRNLSPSRLPVKPPASTVTTRAAAAAQSATSALAAATAAAKPKTGFLGRLAARTTRSTSAQQKAARAEPTTTARSGAAPKLAREAAPVTRRAAAGPPLSSSAPHGGAIARPKTSGGVPGAATTRSAAAGHSRTKSSATALTSTTILRPPSSSSSQTSTSTSTTNTAPSSRPPVTAPPPRALHRRAPSNPAARLLTDPSKQQQQAQKPSRTITPTSPPPPQQPENQRLHRPAFNTNQQHYSPVKSLAPKPLTSTYLAPPSPSKLPANVALSAETSRLQTELLQLHLLHREAAPASVRWHASARARLADRFAAVREAAVRADRAETAAAEDLNAAALKAWTTTTAGGGEALLEERVQALDAVLCGLWAMGEPGGRYARVVRRFEKWADTLRAVVERREEGLAAAGGDVVFVEVLDAAWRDECAVLARRLDGWRRQLVGLAVRGGELDDNDGQAGPAPASSLAAVLGACRELVHDMLAELDVMEQIEREALRQESEWIEHMSRDDSNDDTLKAGAIWRVL
ncbi:hypothetical protein RB595_000580 [Gaeumannomyces hyphopodioides]